MPEFQHNCGAGCACNNCAGCIRAGSRCKIYPLGRARAELAEVAEPLEERLGGDDLVTLNVTDLTLAEVATLLSSVLRDPLVIPAELALEPVSLRFEDTPLSEVVEALGLLTR